MCYKALKSILSIISLFAAGLGYSQSALLDQSFNSIGYRNDNFEQRPQEIRDMIILQDGKILVAGFMEDSSNHVDNYAPIDFVLARYNSNGTPDSTFNGKGYAMTNLRDGFEMAEAIDIQSTGKIISGGYSYPIGSAQNDFALTRHNADGSLDSTFGNGGFTRIDVGGYNDEIHDISVIDGDKIIAFGSTTEFSGKASFCLMRFDSNGSVDSTFGTTGKVITAISVAFDIPTCMKIQSDGKIVVGGMTHNGTDGDFIIVRYLADGTLDASFDSDGIFQYSIADEFLSDLAIQSDGKIVAVGYSGTYPNLEASIIRITSSGALDLSFNGSGYATLDADAYIESFDAISLFPDGKIAVAGSSNDYDSLVGTSVVAIYNSDGTLETAFNSTGYIVENFNPNVEVFATIGIQNDGRIVAAGSTQSNTFNSDFLIARYNTGLVSKAPEMDGRKSGISVFPNPSNGEVSLLADPSLGITDFTIINQMGQEVYKGSLLPGAISKLSLGLPAGLYHLRAGRANNQFSIQIIIN